MPPTPPHGKGSDPWSAVVCGLLRCTLRLQRGVRSREAEGDVLRLPGGQAVGVVFVSIYFTAHQAGVVRVWGEFLKGELTAAATADAYRKRPTSGGVKKNGH